MVNATKIMGWTGVALGLGFSGACGDDGVGFGGFGGAGSGSASGPVTASATASGPGSSGTGASQSAGSFSASVSTTAASQAASSSSDGTTDAASTASATQSSVATTASSSTGGGGPEVCDNLIDDDGNGAVDCNDAACLADCPPPEWTCSPDWWVDAPPALVYCDCDCGAHDPDCDDPANPVFGCEGPAACDASGACIPPPPETCGNGIDDDFDGNADCDDADCLGTVGCAPSTWTCSPVFWDEPAGSEQCDCACGAIDPDCAPGIPVAGCDPGYGCDPAGTCVLVSGEVCANGGIDDDGDNAADCDDQDCLGEPGCPPAGWTCLPITYEEGLFGDCNCGCGAFDPDCSDPGAFVVGCATGELCDGSGVCAPPPPEQCDNGLDDDNDFETDCSDTDCLGEQGCAPLGWTCDPDFYDDALCDCGCGIFDVDCPDHLVGSCQYCDDTGSCNTQGCPGTIDPNDNAKCI